MIYHQDNDLAKAAANAAFKRIEELNKILSDYDPDSEVNQWFGDDTDFTPFDYMSRDLQTCIATSIKFSKASGGAFDVTIGSLTHLWREVRNTGEWPSEDAISQALNYSGWEKLQYIQNTGWISQQKKLRLDFGGIGKGYAADKALQILKEHDCASSFVDIGGDIAAGNPPPEKAGWKIEVRFADTEDTSQILTLSNCGIATSGDSEQFFVIDGQRYSHIIDPRTGYPLINSQGVSVIAQDATTADAMASAISVLGKDEGLKLADKYRNVRVFFQMKN